MNMNGLKITWLGHSTLLLTTPTGRRLLVDPWLAGNPSCPAEYATVESDAILVTHGHFDHVGSLFDAATRCTGPVVCNYETSVWAGRKGIASERLVGMNKGGSFRIPGIDATVTMTDAHHSSSAQDEAGNIIYLGEPAGFVVTVDGCPPVYIAGDTCVFGDMALIAELYEPAVAVLPLGDLFTMSPREAAVACRLLKVQAVIPYHYGTFPLLTGTPADLENELSTRGVVAAVWSGQPGVTFS
jgi:L-ascorbate metabolism protein UlaG (beta-lactamase superfamily)